MSEDQGSARYRGPSALIHEQTVAVVTYNGPEDTIDRLARHFMKLIYNLINCRCRLILAESNDQFDKLDLLRHLTARMPVEQVSCGAGWMTLLKTIIPLDQSGSWTSAVELMTIALSR